MMVILYIVAFIWTVVSCSFWGLASLIFRPKFKIGERAGLRQSHAKGRAIVIIIDHRRISGSLKRVYTIRFIEDRIWWTWEVQERDLQKLNKLESVLYE